MSVPPSEDFDQQKTQILPASNDVTRIEPAPLPVAGGAPAGEEAARVEDESAALAAPVASPAVRREPSPLVWLLRIPVLLLLLLPFIDFVRVAGSRMDYPLELEWLEGEVAMYSVRWTEQRSLAHLYPKYGSTNYVPHLYPPLYQIITAELAGITGGALLEAGRFVSILATLAIMLTVALIVRDATRSWFAGVAGALLYPMFFKVSGYWYDLMRVDSLALAFAMASAWLILRRSSGAMLLLLGGMLAVAAHFTKQTAVFIPVLAVGIRGIIMIGELLLRRMNGDRAISGPWYRNSAAILLLPIPLALLVINLLFLTIRGGLGDMGFYLYEVGRSHVIYYDKIQTEGYQAFWQYMIFLAPLLPLGVWASAFLRPWRSHSAMWLSVLAGISVGACVGLYIDRLDASGLLASRLQVGKAAGALSPDTIRYLAATWPSIVMWSVAATVGGLVPVAIRRLLFGTRLPGVGWLVLLAAGQAVALVTWVKIGGYVNNFMPFFAIASVCFGLVTAWLYRAFERAAGPFGTGLVTLVLGLSVALSWFGTSRLQIRLSDTPDAFSVRVADRWNERLAATPWWVIDGMRFDEPKAITVPIADTTNVREIRDARPLGNQLPLEDSRKRAAEFLDRFRKLHEDGGVYIPHGNFLAVLAGIPPGESVDAIRDIGYGPHATPGRLLQSITERRFRHIVLNMPVEDDWLPGDVKGAIRQHYQLSDRLYTGVHWRFLMPVTGAAVRPTYVYTAKLPPAPPRERSAEPAPRTR